MASTSRVGDGLKSPDEITEEIEEETVWMEEDDHTMEHHKKMEMAYEGAELDMAAQETVADDYHEVDVEEYEEDVADVYRNLPDLLSKKIPLDNGTIMTLCFSKRGIQQMVLNGYLYNMGATIEDKTQWECINTECSAHIVSVDDISSISREGDVHAEMCEPDEMQLRLRVAIYDLRLIVEFTDADIAILYDQAASSFIQENPEFAEIFPSFESMQRSLEVHRRHKIYRRRFEMGMREEKGMILDMDEDDSMMLNGGEEVVEESYNERVPMEGELASNIRLMPYGRQRIFPPTFCVECGLEMVCRSSQYTPQEALVNHVCARHQMTKIQQFVFEAAGFEMWLREVQRCPALRFRRFTLIGDDMYYLCGYDERLPRGRLSQRCHCTAYILIHNYRAVSSRSAKNVEIEYCLNHFSHDLESTRDKSPDILINELRPENFLISLERRRKATAALLRNRMEVPPYRKQLLQLSSSLRRPSSVVVPAPIDDVYSNSRQSDRLATIREIANSRKSIPSGCRLSIRPIVPNSIQDRRRITERKHFTSDEIFDTVSQCELMTDMIIRRLQNVKKHSVANSYHMALSRLVNQIVTDRDCHPENSASTIWGASTSKRRLMMIKKKMNEEEEGEGDDNESDGKKKKKRKIINDKEIDKDMNGDIEDDGDIGKEMNEENEEEDDETKGGKIIKDEDTTPSSSNSFPSYKIEGSRQLPVRRSIRHPHGKVGREVEEDELPLTPPRLTAMPKDVPLIVSPREGSNRLQSKKDKQSY